MYRGGGHPKASLLNSSGLVGVSPTSGSRTHGGHAKADCGASRGGGQQQQGASRSSRLLSASGPPNYPPPQGTNLSQFQHSPLQGPGVRTQSGSF